METPSLVFFALLAGMVGGILASGWRLLHLEMEWHQVRTDLRKYYTRMRNDRALVDRPEPRQELRFEDQIADIRRRNPLPMRGE